ncbi:polyribonucleotide nucleotidyltransferase [Candidatus Roizmanbacteria bacterium RIFCSPHIGHO2_12_FULL_41_11]|uniref:Polyribonucleotide nucleotidyltransferase n=2 Tax=Candidatus Roizmaniibacteriota TaxID=1752723 RepID=A0A1F7I593_9BACT|nr:MAG: polyribonucleotide nucleotidyltransferase [Candidatus Roizmanbacteria bacterium RIFCSPHIGHO2_12_FULL_41_11]
MKVIEESVDIDGQKITLQFGKMAQSATSSVFARMGDTCVLVTVVAGRQREDIDYFPLSIEYAEKLYAGGIIKGSRWVKREGRPSDEAVLKGRIIDRSIRPLFPKNYKRDVQIIITLLSVDAVNPPEILAAVAVSAALHVSPIPWQGPISIVRIGYVKGEEGRGSYIINPTEEEEKYSVLDLVVSSTKDKVNMIETKAEEVSEEMVIAGIKLARETNLKIIEFIENLRKKIGQPKEEVSDVLYDEKLLQILKKDYSNNLQSIIDEKAAKEFGDTNTLTELVETVYEAYKNDEEYDRKTITKAINYLIFQMIRQKVFETKKRIDGRKPDEIRSISVDIAVLPRTHGTGLFQRGDTQVLSIATLGAPSLEQLIEGPEGQEAKSYMHHYYMPPYSVGETGRIGSPSRREIGHGALAEKAIEPVLPSSKEFPYTIRIVSEVLSSNGSTSMASTCGSTLALMDAGVPIKAAVAGIAMGLYSKSEKDYIILSDIMGIEDFSGDMDFKVTGSANGITAIQLDVKIAGLTDEMIVKVLAQAKDGRMYILGKMTAVISKSRKELSQFAPKVILLTPPPDKIGEIIGPGGKNIRALIAKTQTEINVSDDGKVTISGIDKAKVEEAAKLIENITREVQVGETFKGPVKRILPFGAFVEILPGKEGMVHVSKMGRGYVRNPGDVVKLGQEVEVRVYQLDNQGRINLEMINQRTEHQEK